MVLKTGLNHIEIWVSSIQNSQIFYGKLFNLIGWRKLESSAWSNKSMEIYLHEEKDVSHVSSLGVHHVCFQATERAVVDKVAEWLRNLKHPIYEGPIKMAYSKGYYTVGFYDPDGFILEVAYTPHMKL